MFIAKFHNLVRSRLLWAGFLVVIVFMFVIWGTVTTGGRSAADRNAVGQLDGKPVKREEFARAFSATYLSIVLNMERPPQFTPELEELVRKAAWRRLAALRQAEALGLMPDNEEVAAAIQSFPGFGREGQFDPAIYQAFAEQRLHPLGFSILHFEEFVRQEIALQKLRYMLDQTALVSPHEVERAMRVLSETFEADLVAVRSAEVEKEVEVSEEDARSLFLRDPSRFTLPERVKVRYVAIPFQRYAEGIEITEEEALRFYNDHLDLFKVTNQVEVAEASETNGVAQTSNQVVQLTFEEVRTNIVARLLHERSREKAVEAATEWVIQLAPDREGRAPKFDELMKEAGLEIHEAGPFALQDRLDFQDAGRRFNEAAFALRDTPSEYFSDAVVGSNTVYILALTERLPSRVPEFEEVKDLALSAARQEAVRDALAAKAAAARAAMEEAIQKGTPVSEALAALGLEARHVGPFTLSEGLEEEAHSSAILSAVLKLNEGEISEPIPIAEGLLIVHVTRREAGDMTELESSRGQITDAVRRQRGGLLFSAWQESLLRKGKWEDYLARPESEPAPEELPEDEI